MKTKLKRNVRRSISIVLCAMMIISLITAAMISPDALDYNVTSSYTSGKYYTALKNVTLTGNNRTDIVNIARSQVGYMEGNNSSQLDGTTANGSGNYTEYGRWYGLQDMWCAMFVSWCANLAGVKTSIVPKTASTVTALNYFINQGVAHTRASVSAGNYAPIAGDIIFFKSGRNSAITNHIGIVTSYSGTTINTIEGNTSSATVSTNGGCVRAKSYSITNTYIVYVCRPKYASDTTTTNTVQFDSSKYDYRYWPSADSRWGNKIIGSGSATVGNSSGITTAVTKLAIQAGLHTANGFPVDNFVDIMNSKSGYTAAGSMYWDKARESADFTGVDANLMSETDTGVAFADEKQQVINWILEGKHLALYVADSKGVKSWVAVDEALTLSTGEIYIMDDKTDIATNAKVKVADKYVNLRRVACFTGGQIAYEEIGSDDYRIWRKIDNRWKTTVLGGAHDVYEKGDLIIASTKLAIQAGLKNPQLYNVNNAIADTKTGSNGGFSTDGNMYWADAAQALGFDGYNANLKASGSYSVSSTKSELINYINQGKHLVIYVNNTWVAVDEGKTLDTNEIWVWSSNIDAEDNGEKTGDNIRTLSSISNGYYTRVACFTGGKIKSSQEQYVFLPGTFNNWAENRPMTKRSDGKYEKTVYLPAGSYEFKILDDGYWHGNQGTISNTNESDNNGYGWEFPGEDYGGNHNCTLTAAGGYYTFVYAAGGYSDHPYHLVIKYSSTPPQEGTVNPVVDSGAEDYRKWNITDERWADTTLGSSSVKMSSTTAGYGDLYAAAAKLMISCGLSTPDTMDPGKMAELIRSNTNDGQFSWDGLDSKTALTKVNTSLIANGTYETRLGGRTAENTGKTFKQYILENHYHLFIKIDDFSGGYGWALVDEAMTASATGDEIYVWLSKSTASKGTDDNPVLLSSISTTFKRVAAFTGGNNIVQSTFSGTNDAELSATYSYNGMEAEINSGDYVPYNASVTINATPAEGYEYTSWTDNLSSGDDAPSKSASMFKYTATSSASITYNTSARGLNISYSEASHFTYGTKPTTANQGDSVSFSITPDTDYKASVFIEKDSGDSLEYTMSNNVYTFTMPSADVNISIEMNYEDYRTWSRDDLRWANTQLGTSSYKVSGNTAGMGDLVVAVTKLSKQAGSSVVDVNDAVTKLNSGGGLGTTGYLDWSGTVSSTLGFNSYHLYNTSGTASGKASEIIAGINDGKHYVIKIDNTLGWVAVDEKLTLITGDIYVMRSLSNTDGNADIKLSDISSSFSNYAYFTGGTTPSYTTHTVSFTSSEHINVSASYTIGSNPYSITSGSEVPDGYTVRFRASTFPDYEFDRWVCNVDPDESDTSELVVTVNSNVTVSCVEKEKDSADTVLPLKIKYVYMDYDPELSDTFEYKSDNEYLSEKSFYSTGSYEINKDDLNNNTVLTQKVITDSNNINVGSDYFNYEINTSGVDFTDIDRTSYDYGVDAYVISVDMTPEVRTYDVYINGSLKKSCHFQEELELDAASYNVSDAVWVDGANNIYLGNKYKFRVPGNLYLTVQEKNELSSLDDTSVINHAYTKVTTDSGVEKCMQNFYIRDFIDVNDSEKELVGAGVFYAVFNKSTGKPSKSAVTSSLNNLETYAKSFENSETIQSIKSLVYNNKDTGLSYSYINYSSDNAKNYSDRVLRNPRGEKFIHYIFESSINNKPADYGKYEYRVYSFFIYRQNGELKAVVSSTPGAADVYNAD